MRMFYCSFDDLNHEKIMLEIGQKAPDFKLINTDRKEVTLENFKEKISCFSFFRWPGPARVPNRCVPFRKIIPFIQN